MYYTASLFLAFLVTIFLLSKLAKMLNAKNAEIGWIFGALLLGIIIASLFWVSFLIIDLKFDPYLMVVFILVAPFSIAYKYINKLNWSGAFTLNVAGIAIGLLTLVAATVFNGKSIDESLNFIQTFANKDASVSSDVQDNSDATELSEETAQTETPIEESITELDLLPAKAVRDIKRKEKKTYKEPKFRVVSISNIYSAIGHKIRIHRRNGNTIIGGLKRVEGGDLLVSWYENKGNVVMPISISKIQKVEVYK